MNQTMDGPVNTLKGMESRLNRYDGISGEDRNAFKVQMEYLKRYIDAQIMHVKSEMMTLETEFDKMCRLLRHDDVLRGRIHIVKHKDSDKDSDKHSEASCYLIDDKKYKILPNGDCGDEIRD